MAQERFRIRWVRKNANNVGQVDTVMLMKVGPVTVASHHVVLVPATKKKANITLWVV